MKKILITGITGQDGIFLTSKILKSEDKIEIIGVSRNKNLKPFYENLKKLNITKLENVKVENVNLIDKVAVQQFLESKSPSEIYNLSGPSSVNKSFSKDSESYEKIVKIFENLVSGSIKSRKFPAFFQASSSEMFSPDAEEALTEESLMKPNSPYAEAKYHIHNEINLLVEKFNWNIISGIMFNHESEYRDRNYLMPKIIDYSKNINLKNKSKLKIGSLDYVRDWSYAGDIMDAVYKLMSNGATGSFVIGSGTGNTIQKMIEIIFQYQNLNWKDFIEIDPTLLRKGDPLVRVANPKKINDMYKWKVNLNFEDLVIKCLTHELSV